jgi:phospholipase C
MTPRRRLDTIAGRRDASPMLERRVLALALSGLLIGCASDESLTPVGPLNWDRTVVPPPDQQAADGRAACLYTAGALPAETQGASHPSGAAIPIDHLVVIMQENRSFDSYFQKLPEYGQPDVEVAPPGFSNPDNDGNPVGIYHETRACVANTIHSWAGEHLEANDGQMDGFVRTNEGRSEQEGLSPELLGGDRAMGYYDANDLPFYYKLAGDFAIADHYHASILGPTWPNRMYLYAASSYGRTQNVNFVPDATLFDELETRGVDWKVYFSDQGGLGDYLRALMPNLAAHERTLAQYHVDAATGALPQVAFVNATFNATTLATSTWEHAPDVIQVGQRFVAEVVDALAKSPNWPRSALFLTYDENGGLFDHVPPPAACAPDAHAPEIEPKDPPGGFDQLGVRVPMILVSPWAKRHYVGHHVYDHTSIVRFIEALHTLPALTARDANAEAPWDMFDFSTPEEATPPAIELPTVDAAVVAACDVLFDPAAK